MDNLIGMNAFASAPDFGGFGMAPDLENAFQAWLADGNTGTLSDFLSEQGGSSEAFSTDSGSEGEAADAQKDAPLIAPEAPKQEYGGLLSNQPMIGLDRALTQPQAPAPPPVSGRGFLSFAGAAPSTAQSLDVQPRGDVYGPPLMPLTVESRVNADMLTPPARSFLERLGDEHFPGLRAISGFRDPEHNRRVGGASNSRHTVGDAIDFDVSQLNDEQKQRFLNIAKESGARGLGIYPSGRSIHLDFRETPAVWGGNPNSPYSGNQNPAAYPRWAQPTVSAFAEGGIGPIQTAGSPQRSGSVPFANEIAAASRETGIPEPLLRAKLQQESGFNPNAIGRAGEIGLAQIMPSTARDPGFGVEPISADQLRDPAENIRFGARYLAARGRAAGVTDWNDPEQAAIGLRAYNGGGDPNYVANVMRHMGDGSARIQASAFAPEPMARPGNLPTSYESRMAGIGAVPVEQNGFTQASFPRVEMMTTSPAEALRDTPGLLNPEVTMPGRAPLANTPTMRGAIDPGFIYQEQPRPLPDMPSAFPNAVPDVIRNAPSNARPLMASPSREADKPAPNANTAKGRSPMQPQDIPPDYSTWADAGIQDFLRRDAEARGAVLPNPFGGIGAAVSSGLSSIGGLLRGGSNEAPAALPAPPVGQSPVARAAPVAQPSAPSAGQATNNDGSASEASVSGDMTAAPPAQRQARVNPPRPALNPLGLWGEAARRNQQLEAEWQGKVGLVDELEARGISREQAVNIVNNPQAMQLALSRVTTDRERAFNQQLANVAFGRMGEAPPDAGVEAARPTDQARLNELMARLRGVTELATRAQSEVNQRNLGIVREQLNTDIRRLAKDVDGQLDRRLKELNVMEKERAAREGNTPAGFERAEDGRGVRPIAGGPQDPNYLRERKRAEVEGQGGRPLAHNQISDLSSKGGAVTSARRYLETFKPDFAGWGNETVGNMANVIARNTGIGNEAGATWWQDYDRHKNQVRNELFGSALTRTEAEAFIRADIHPGMTPDAIKRNLEIQERAAKGAARKLANAYIAQNRNRDEIEGALGVSLSDLGVGDKPSDQKKTQDAPSIREGSLAENPRTGERIVFRNGKWEPVR